MILCKNLEELQLLFPFGRTKLLALLKAKALPVVKIGQQYATSAAHIANWLSENMGKEIFFD